MKFVTLCKIIIVSQLEWKRKSRESYVTFYVKSKAFRLICKNFAILGSDRILGCLFLSNIMLDSLLELLLIGRFRKFGENYDISYVKSAKTRKKSNGMT